MKWLLFILGCLLVAYINGGWILIEEEIDKLINK